MMTNQARYVRVVLKHKDAGLHAVIVALPPELEGSDVLRKRKVRTSSHYRKKAVNLRHPGRVQAGKFWADGVDGHIGVQSARERQHGSEPPHAVFLPVPRGRSLVAGFPGNVSLSGSRTFPGFA